MHTCTVDVFTPQVMCVHALDEALCHWVASFLDVHMTHHMYVGLGWYFLSWVNINKLLHVGYQGCWYSTSNVSRRIFIGYRRCLNNIIDIGISIFAGYRWCFQSPFNIGTPMCARFGRWGSPHPTSTGHCIHAKGNVVSPHPTSVDYCF